MGLTTPFSCPIPGCDYKASFRLGMGEELDPEAHAEREAILRVEHPNHPTQGRADIGPIVVGDPFVLDANNVGDCPAEFEGVGGLLAFCVLDEGHAGQHVATDGTTVIETWS